MYLFVKKIFLKLTLLTSNFCWRFKGRLVIANFMALICYSASPLQIDINFGTKFYVVIFL